MGCPLTRFINTVLITVFAFFVFLGVFWQFAGGGTGAGARGDPTVIDVAPRWQPGAPQDLLIDVTLHNPAGQDGQVASITYEAKVDGEVVDKAIARVPAGPPVVVPGKGDGVVHFTVDLPEGFIRQWWPAYMQHAEKAELSIQGTVSLRRDDGVHDATFEWRSAWTGELAAHLAEAVKNCDETPTDLCVANSDFVWKEGKLHATLVLHNPGPEALAVRNASVRLLFGEQAVVSGDVDLVRELEADTDTEVPLVLTFSQAAIDTWWPDHIARCERTPLVFGMDLQAQALPATTGEEEGEPGRITTLQWTFPASPFQTRFVCAQ
jgi:LEA14-like dessication related protein